MLDYDAVLDGVSAPQSYAGYSPAELLDDDGMLGAGAPVSVDP